MSEIAANVKANVNTKRRFLGEDQTLSIRTKVFAKKMKDAEIRNVIQTIMPLLDFKGKVQLKHPKVQLDALLIFAENEKKGSNLVSDSLDSMLYGFIGRRVSESGRVELLRKYDLRTRPYIGTTSTKVIIISLIMAHV